MHRIRYLSAVFVFVSAHAAQTQPRLGSTWPAWLKARGERQYSGDFGAEPSGASSTNVTPPTEPRGEGLRQMNERLRARVEALRRPRAAPAQADVAAGGVAQSGDSSTGVTPAAVETMSAAADPVGVAKVIGTTRQESRQENERSPAEVDALGQPRAAAVQAGSAAEESAARSGDNSTNVAQSGDNSTNATLLATPTTGGKGGWRSWLKKLGGRITTVARSGGNSTDVPQSGDNSTNAGQSGDNSTNVALSGGNGTDVAQSGGNSTIAAQTDDSSANMTPATDEPIPANAAPIKFAKMINNTEAERDSPSPAASPTASRSAAAVGDPHLQNIHGERFDLMRPGKHVLIHIPRKQRVKNVMLRVEARVRRLGDQCADLYFQELNITGSWVPHGRAGGLRFQAQGVRDERPKWLKLGRVRVKVVHGHTLQGYRYLNFYVKDLGRAEFPVGGLLGEDDHTEAAMPSEACAHRLSLIQVAARTDQGAPLLSPAGASLA